MGLRFIDGEEFTVHVLTKIFVVLVSLLAVLLVPLVVVYAYNENSYKARFQSEEGKRVAAETAQQAAESRFGAREAELQAKIAELDGANRQLKNETGTLQASNLQLESQLAAAQAGQAEVRANIGQINTNIKAGQQLTETLVAEARSLRKELVDAKKEYVKLDESLREVTSQLEVAEQARRALAEELARLKDEHSKAMVKLGEAIAKGFGSRDDVRATVLPDKTLTATIIRVQRANNEILAEIDAGSRDGVKKDWSMTIGRGGEFIGSIRIINVDVNRATGIITLEERSGKRVQVGDKAHAIAGQE